MTSATVTSITHVRRTGAGVYEDVGTVFRFTSAEHSGSQGDLMLHLQVKTVRKNIPGGNEVIEQVLSSSWQPFDITGEWDDKWANKRDASIVSTGSYAITTFYRLAEFVSNGPSVRVVVGSLSFVGIITDLKIRYRRDTQIGWSATLSPHKNENVPQTRVQEPIRSQSIEKWIQDSDDHVQEIQGLFDDVSGPDDDVPVPMATPRFDQYRGVLAEINDALDRLQGINSTGLETETTRKLLLLATTFRRLRGACLQATLALSRLTAPLEIAFEDVLQSARFTEWVTSSTSSAWRTVGTSRSAERDVLSRASQRPRAIHRARAGESLERISLRYYGTANNWRAIYDKNNMSSLVLSGGEELLIPDRVT